MKYIKLLAMMLLPLAFAACSDDDENMNSGNATVGFSQSAIDVKENISSILVPITVTGEHNGLIEVNVTVKEATGLSMENNKTIILTSEKIRIPADVETVNAEIYLNVSTKEDNFDRSFTLEITNVQGASVGTNICKANIQEVVDPYEKLAGEWTFIGDGKTFDVTIATNEKGDGYNCVGFNGRSCEWRMLYSLKGLQIVANETIISGLKFTGKDEWGECSIRFATYIPPSSLNFNNISGIWNDDFDTITFETGICGAIFDQTDNFAGSIWFGFGECSMKKK